MRVAVLGAGTVGSRVAATLIERRAELSARAGADLEVVGIAVRNIESPRDVDLPRELLTTDAQDLVTRADIVIELIGGIEPARSLIERAIDSGADVVTGNKALLAAHGDELSDRAHRAGVAISDEAAVAAAIPILRPLRDSLAGDNIRRILAIVNGSTNFILDRMHRFGDTAESAQNTARDLGYLEADPTLDVEGFDAAQKAAILARLAFHADVPESAVYREGITSITAEQVATAREAGYVIKLLAIAEKAPDGSGDDGVSVRVYPALLQQDHPLSTVHGGNNAVFVEAELAGPLMFYGAGAGGPETASAVLGDVVSAARRRVENGPATVHSTTSALPIVPIERVTTRFYITLNVLDRPGVLADVAGIFSRGGVSVETVRQEGAGAGAAGHDAARLVIGTHLAEEQNLRTTVAELAEHPSVESVQSVLRVEGAQ